MTEDVRLIFLDLGSSVFFDVLFAIGARSCSGEVLWKSTKLLRSTPCDSNDATKQLVVNPPGGANVGKPIVGLTPEPGK